MAKKKAASIVTQIEAQSLTNRFRGKNVAIIGRYSYYPSKDQIQDFIKSQGGKLVDKIDNKLDALFVGEGRTTAKLTKAEKLNASGDADIEILDNLSNVFPNFAADLRSYLTDEKVIFQLGSLLKSFPWLTNHVDLVFKAEDFSGLTIGSKTGKDLKLPIKFQNCGFTKTKFFNIDFECDYYSRSSINGQFDQCQFDALQFGSVSSTTFTSSKGKYLAVDDANRCKFLNSKTNMLRIRNISECQLEGGTIGEMEMDWYRNEIKKSEILNVKIKKWTFTDCEITDSQIEKIDVSLIGAKTFEATDSSFHNCQFKKGKIGTLNFQNCELTDTCFANLECDTLVISDCEISGLEFKRCKITNVMTTEDQVKKIKGLSASSIKDYSGFDKLLELVEVMKASDKVEFSIEGIFDKNKCLTIQASKQWSWNFEYHGQGKEKGHHDEKNLQYHYSKTIKDSEIHFHFGWLMQSSRIEDFNLGSLKTKTSKCSLKPKELKKLITDALYQVLGKSAPTEDELKKAAAENRKKRSGKKNEILLELKEGNVEALNNRSTSSFKENGPFRNLELPGVDLAGLNASGINLGASDLSKANLAGADLSGGAFLKTNFSTANLSNSNLSESNLKEADLSKANLSNSNLHLCQLKDAVLNGTNLQGVNFCDVKNHWGTDLCGVDLSKTKMKSAKVNNCSYDEKTKLPKSLTKTQLKSMYWTGGGLPPHERKQNKVVTGPLDFPLFMDRLTEITDQSRLKKAMKMLKADSFQLFCEVTDQSVFGVVKSQSDDSLVYSCTINSEGGFACCTQNLNPCGGLRGAICKHILVLIVGLTKDDQIDAASIDQWVNDSKMKSPELDKDKMSEVLLKHKGAEAGEIDWRPTETVPEDFMAF